MIDVVVVVGGGVGLFVSFLAFAAFDFHKNDILPSSLFALDGGRDSTRNKQAASVVLY